jgi:hypothetical protein
MYDKGGGGVGAEPRGGTGAAVSARAAAPESCSAGGGLLPVGEAASALSALPTREASSRAARLLMLRVCTFGRAPGLPGGEAADSLLTDLSLLVLLGLPGGITRGASAVTLGAETVVVLGVIPNRDDHLE